MLPLLSVYLENLGFTGVEIGSIFSIRAITCIFIPPVCGLLSDRFHNHKQLLLVTFILSLVTSVLLPFAKSFILFALAYAFFNIFQTATGPLSDSVALHSSIPFGSIRKWGSYGFAIAALIAGYASRVFGVSVIFVVFGVSTLVAIASTLQLNVHVESSEHNMKDELRLLLRNKKFLVFLFYSFLIGGTIMSHNTFFGIFYKSLGGNVAWIGLAFFLFAISEVPFITLTSRLISRFGIFNVLIFSTLTGIFRWFFYYSAPSVFLILILFPLQGIFFGTFIAATAEYIKTTISPSVRSTAVTAYAAIFVGGGGACGSYIGGYIYDYINIESVYGFFGLINIVGLFVMLYLKKISLPKT
jgi:PPP family 3-phenylpropionic acid transporter